MREDERLKGELLAVARLRDHLRQEFGDDIPPDILDCAVESETDAFELIAKLGRFVLETEAMVAALDELAASRMARKRRLETTSARARELVGNALAAIGKPKHVFPDMTISHRQGEEPVVLSGEVPKEYCKDTVVSKPNMAYIREDLESGKKLPFAALGVPKRIVTIRIK